MDPDDIEFICILEVDYELEDRKLKVTGKHPKKKEAERLAYLKACEILDRNGLLADYYAMRDQELKRLKDLGDNDEEYDTYTDRTKRAKIDDEEFIVETPNKKANRLKKEIQELNEKLASTNQDGKKDSQNEEDELDAFMSNIQSTINHESKMSLEKMIQEKETELRAIVKTLPASEQAAFVDTPPVRLLNDTHSNNIRHTDTTSPGQQQTIEHARHRKTTVLTKEEANFQYEYDAEDAIDCLQKVDKQKQKNMDSVYGY
jgi:hypothetical protein